MPNPMTTEEILWNHTFEREPECEVIEVEEIDDYKSNMDLFEQLALNFRPTHKIA